MMTATLLALHVLGAAYWLGSAAFMIFYVVPTAIRTGPEGRVFLGNLVTTSKFQVAFGIAAGTTILSGIVALWILSGGFQPAFMASSSGRLISLGAFSGIVAMVFGIVAGRLQARGTPFARASLGCLVLALILMVFAGHF